MEDINKELSILRSSYDMYEKTKKDTKKNLKAAKNEDGTPKYSNEKINETLKIIEISQSDIIEKYKMLGGDINDLTKKSNKKIANKEDIDIPIYEKIMNARNEQSNSMQTVDSINNEKELSYVPVNKSNEGNIKALYDVIPLPSNGECYRHKKGKLPVSYLTAYDENLIVSPNLYKDGTFIDYLLKEKIMNTQIEPSELTIGDRDAIILWLRATGYGNEFPVTATDDITGERFDTVIDLSQIKYKKFNLKGDENGYFDFILPNSGDKIKFKFLTYKDEKDLELLETIEDKQIKKERLSDISETLKSFVDSDDNITKTQLVKINEAIRIIETWSNEIENEKGVKFTHAVTNRLEMSIMSINDITDRKYIKNYVLQMNVKDASALRKYITENEPGLDYNIVVKKPESLGGGSMNMFLKFDQYIFLNIA